MSDGDIKNDEFWRDKLSPEEFQICRMKGTERAFTGAYWDNKEKGAYRCRCCNELLFDSETKYDSGSGWPSFYQALDKDKVVEHLDTTHGMVRTEICCGTCGSHLGHVFTDGPNPTGLRYCVNSASLSFEAQAE
jgi:peptide-methionine (R)-S-oxide reductase